MKVNKRIIFAILGVVIVILGAAFILSPRAPKDYSGKMDSITIAMPRLESSALHWIAEERHFFSRNGLNVTFHEPGTGLAALGELLKGEADMAGTAEFPLVSKVFEKERVRIIACTDKADYMFLQGRRDRRIEKVSDLRGKRVGIIPGTIEGFYLGRFLNLNGTNMGGITLVDVKTSEETVNALINGSVDAVVVAEPFASSVKDSLGANVVVWRVQSSQSLYGLVVSTEEWIKRHPELVTRFLKSLSRAEDYLIRNPAEAKAIVQKWLNVDVAFVQAAWSRNQFSLSLDQALIAAMEDEARWMIANKLTSEKEIPDFFDYIYLDGLKTVKPGVVNIMR
jgi:NitT/TauT family transport system substrate-binding protein